MAATRTRKAGKKSDMVQGPVAPTSVQGPETPKGFVALNGSVVVGGGNGMGSTQGSTCYLINTHLGSTPVAPKALFTLLKGTVSLGRIQNHLQWLKARGCVQRTAAGWVATGYEGVGKPKAGKPAVDAATQDALLAAGM